jgi:hypothetical protein
LSEGHRACLSPLLDKCPHYSENSAANIQVFGAKLQNSWGVKILLNKIYNFIALSLTI